MQIEIQPEQSGAYLITVNATEAMHIADVMAGIEPVTDRFTSDLSWTIRSFVQRIETLRGE